MVNPENLAKLKRDNHLPWCAVLAGQMIGGNRIRALGRSRACRQRASELGTAATALNRVKSYKVDERQFALVKRFHNVGLLSGAQFADVQARFRPAGTEKYLLQGVVAGTTTPSCSHA